MSKVRKSRDWNQGLDPEAEPLPTMLQEAWSEKMTNHYKFKASWHRAVLEKDQPHPLKAHRPVGQRTGF